MAEGAGSTVIGIDLGTTYSCVGVLQNDRVKIIPNENGHPITPSYVSFTEKGHIVGDEAKSKLTINPRHTAFEVKRFIGRSHDDIVREVDTSKWPFEIRQDGDAVKVAVFPGGNPASQVYKPEEISAKVLMKMKKLAEDYLKQTVTQAVITVPAYFNIRQREATKAAGRLANLEVLRVINEPEAAALAFNHMHSTTSVDKERGVLVFDLGGGTFDVSVLIIDGGTIEVQAKRGDMNLGGSDFDNGLVVYCLDWFNKKMHPKNPVSILPTSRPYNRLRRACEVAKCTLSGKDETRIRIEKFHEESEFDLKVSRATFEDLNEEHFYRTMAFTKDVLRDARMEADDIDEVLLVGGSTRIPRIQSLLKEMFPGRSIRTTIDPDQAVAYGAAIQAAILSGVESEELENVLLMDVTPLSLGVLVKGGIMSTIVTRNTLIPISMSGTYTTGVDDQTTMSFTIYQGERPMVKDNNKIGRIDIGNLPKAPAGVAEVKATFMIDDDGILDVIVKNLATGKTESVTVENSINNVTDDQATEEVAVAQNHALEDEAERNRVIACNKLEAYVKWVPRMIKDCRSNMRDLGNRYLDGVVSECETTIQWIDCNANAPQWLYTQKMQQVTEKTSKIHEAYKSPGDLPPELKSKYNFHMDDISIHSQHHVNDRLDLD